MSPQMACMRRCIVALVAFVWLFSTVCFQMLPQMACMRRCIVTLAAFMWLFSTVCFQMSPQIACMRRNIATLITFAFWFNEIVSHFFLYLHLCPFSFTQMIASNWVKFIIDFWSLRVKLSKAYFHFLCTLVALNHVGELWGRVFLLEECPAEKTFRNWKRLYNLSRHSPWNFQIVEITKFDCNSQFRLNIQNLVKIMKSGQI